MTLDISDQLENKCLVFLHFFFIIKFSDLDESADSHMRFFNLHEE